MISSQAGGTGASSAGYGRRNTSYYSSHPHRKSTLITTTPTKRINSVATIGPDDVGGNSNRIDVSSFRHSTLTVGGATTLGGTSGVAGVNLNENNAGFFRNIFSKNCRAYLTTIILNAMKNLNNSEGK